jgi:hypothetical protein
MPKIPPESPFRYSLEVTSRSPVPVPAIDIRPGIGYLQKRRIPVLRDELDGLLILFVFIPVFAVKFAEDPTGPEIRTVSTGDIPSMYAADLDPAPGLAEIPLSGIVAYFTPFARLFLQCPACPAIRATAAYVCQRHTDTCLVLRIM